MTLVAVCFYSFLCASGCVTTTSTDKSLLRRIGKAPKIEYIKGNTFSSGTINWKVIDEFKIQSVDGKFVILGLKDNHKKLKQFFHAITRALDFVKEKAPNYYDMMRQVDTNTILLVPMLEEKCGALGQYRRGGPLEGYIFIGDIEIGPYTHLYILSSLLVHEIAIHANEQIVIKKRKLDTEDAECEAHLYQLKFFEDIGIRRKYISSSTINFIEKYLRKNSEGYFKYIKDLDSTNNPKLAKLQLDLKKYLKTHKSNYLPLEGLIENYHEYITHKYPSLRIYIWDKYDPERAHIERTKKISGNLNPNIKKEDYMRSALITIKESEK